MSASSSSSSSYSEQPPEVSSEFFSKIPKVYKQIPKSKLAFYIPENVPISNHIFILRLETSVVGKPNTLKDMELTNIYLGKVESPTSPIVHTFKISHGTNVATNSFQKLEPPLTRSFIKNSIDKPWFYLFINYDLMAKYIDDFDKSVIGKKRSSKDKESTPKRSKSVGIILPSEETNTRELNLPSEPVRTRAHSFDDDGGTEVDPDELSLTFDEDLFNDDDIDSSLDKKGGKRKTRKRKHTKKHKKRKKTKRKRKSIRKSRKKSYK